VSLHEIIENYGYIAIVLGTFVEGETVLLMAGFAASRGYLQIEWVILAALGGGLSGDLVFFYLGRRHARAILERLPLWKARADRVHQLLERYHSPVVMASRFLYGLRTVTPAVLGMGSIETWRFIVLDSIGAVVWAVSMGTLAFYFGSALESAVGNAHRYEALILALIFVLGLSTWFVWIRVKRRRAERLKA